jgi:hypothetical protein
MVHQHLLQNLSLASYMWEFGNQLSPGQRSYIILGSTRILTAPK